jgi:hypothetical protein
MGFKTAMQLPCSFWPVTSRVDGVYGEINASAYSVWHGVALIFKNYNPGVIVRIHYATQLFIEDKLQK